MIKKIHIDIENYKLLMNAVSNVPGSFAEFGVFQGATFAHIYLAALEQDRPAHAVDSFIGMPEPVIRGDAYYRRGLFNCNGSASFRKAFPDAIVHEGFVPDILSEMSNVKFAFTHIDLDHEISTKRTLDWIWSHMSTGGIVVCHDYWSDANHLASKAINDWMKENGIKPDGIHNYSIWFVKSRGRR